MRNTGEYFWEMQEARQERRAARCRTLDRIQGIPPTADDEEEESTTEQDDEQ